jgi:hypothetical protein
VATIAEMIVTQEKWDALSPEMQELARKTGIKPESEAKKEKTPALPKVKVATQKQYILRIEETCGLCDEKYVRTFRMTPTLDKETPYLKALIEPGKDVKVDKTERRTRRTCEFCYLNLMFWTTQKLVTRCISLADPKVEQFIKHREFKLQKEEERKAAIKARKELEKMQEETDRLAKKQKRRKKRR